MSVAPTATLRRHVEALEVSAKGRVEAGEEGQSAPVQGVLRRRRKLELRRDIIARVEAGEEGRFIVTNLGMCFGVE